MLFAPHPGTFRAAAGKDVIDQIKFAHDQGFRAWEHNGLGNETPEIQEKVGKTLSEMGMTMGVFVAYANFDQPTFARKDDAATKEVLSKIETAIGIAKRCNAKWFTVVPGSIDQQHNGNESWNKYGSPRLAPGYQDANAIELLRRCSEMLEPHELTMVLEPLNWLRTLSSAFSICFCTPLSLRESPTCCRP